MFDTPTAEAVERGCGTRTKGGVYAEMGLSPFGTPIEERLWCPPVPINIAEFGLTPINVKLFEREGIWHIMDWIGTSNYPRPTDYIEEIRRFGLSAKLELASAEEYEKLTDKSRILPVHAKAYIVSTLAYWQDRQMKSAYFDEHPYPWRLCPKSIAEHEDEQRVLAETANLDYIAPSCLGLCYEDVAEAEPVSGRCGIKTMPSFRYHCAQPPANHVTNYSPAIFAAWPISRLVVVRDPDGNTHEFKLEKLAHVKAFPVDLVEE